jgi:hypothetical protein
MKIRFQKYYLHFIVLTMLVVIANLAMSTRYFMTDAQLAGDQRYYYEVGRTIAQGNTWVEHIGTDIGAGLAPGYSFILAGVFYIYGDNVANAYYLNIILHTFIAVFMFYLMMQISNTLFAWLFSIWLFFYYQIWRMNYQVMMEISTIFIIAIVFFFLFIYVKNQQIKYLVIFSVLAGILVFVNNRFIFHLAVMLITIPVYAYFTQYFRYKDVVIVGIGIILVLLPWHIRQYLHYDEVVIFAPGRTEIISSAVERGDDSIQNEIHNRMQQNVILSYDQYLEGFKNISGMTESRMTGIRERFTEEKYVQMVREYENKYNGGYRKVISRLAGFWRIWQFDFSFKYGGDTRIVPPARLSANIINILFLTPMFLFFIAGVVYGFYNKAVFIQMVSIFILSHWILHGYIHYISRYRVTVLPLIFLVGWYGIYRVFQSHAIIKIKKKYLLRYR